MIVVTTNDVPGRTVKQTLGLVCGNSLGRVYNTDLALSQELAVDWMSQRAEAMGANAVLAVRFSTSRIVDSGDNVGVEILAYGTAAVAE